MAVKEFFVNLGPEDRVRMRIVTDHGQVSDFVAQYETMIHGDFRPVVRYDASHGHGHRDILDEFGRTIDKTWMPNHLSLNECLSESAQDLRRNWDKYRYEFMERIR